jgi:hypothetical protein
MGRRRRASAVIASLVAAMLVAGRARAQQQVGHKALGTLGLQAGSQAPADYGGSALAAALRGARDVAYGVGPEVDLALPPVLGQLTLRYTQDVADRTRPVGHMVVIGWVARVCSGGRR